MSLHASFPYQLYLVISEKDCAGRDLLDVAEQAISGGVDIIQLREKKVADEAFLKNAQQLKELTDKHKVPLIINDNASIAAQVNAAGIHVGNSDIPPSVLASNDLFKNKIIGYSIEYLSQLQNEHIAASDYLGISPVFKTETKKDTVTEWGLIGVATIRQLTSKPLVAIGNIHLKNARSVIDAGANCIAVVSAICAADDPQKAAYELKNEILK